MTARRSASETLGPEAEARARGVELLISNLLRGGVIASLTLVITGTILSFVRHPAYVSSPAELEHLTQPGAAFPSTWQDVAAGVRDLQGQAVAALGLLLLIATPIARVAVSVLTFIYQRDRGYALITVGVLCLLLLSFLLGGVE